MKKVLIFLAALFLSFCVNSFADEEATNGMVGGGPCNNQTELYSHSAKSVNNHLMSSCLYKNPRSTSNAVTTFDPDSKAINWTYLSDCVEGDGVEWYWHDSAENLSAKFKDENGEATEFPESGELVIGQTYQISATYSDPDDLYDSYQCYLKIEHSTYPLTMVYSTLTEEAYARDWEGALADDYLSPISVTRIDNPDDSITLKWNFFIKSDWLLALLKKESAGPEGLDFSVAADEYDITNIEDWTSAGESLKLTAPDYGATIITHGLIPFGGFPEWPLTMGKAIGERIGNALVYKLDPQTGLFFLIDGGTILPLDEDKYGKEIILIMDWTSESNVMMQGYSEAAADAFLAALINHQYSSDIYFLDKLHFIGHSRGCVVTSEIIERIVNLMENPDSMPYEGMGESISVTYLDPHPISSDMVNPDEEFPDVYDQVIVWDGVRYADNYYQSNSFLAKTLNPVGMPVEGAYNNDLDSNIDGGINHTEVHAWYFGTIDPEATNNEVEKIVQEAQKNLSDQAPDNEGIQEDVDITDDTRQLWYKDDKGLIEGFAHSPNGGNNIESREAPDETRAPFYDYIRDGIFNGDFTDRSLISNISDLPGWQYQGGRGKGRSSLNTLLELNGGLKYYRTHNWSYIPTNVSKLSFKYRIETGEEGDSLGEIDELQVLIGKEVIFTKLLEKQDESVFFVPEEIALYSEKDNFDFRNTVDRITFRIAKRGLFLTTKIYIDDVRFTAD